MKNIVKYCKYTLTQTPHLLRIVCCIICTANVVVPPHLHLHTVTHTGRLSFAAGSKTHGKIWPTFLRKIITAAGHIHGVASPEPNASWAYLWRFFVQKAMVVEETTLTHDFSHSSTVLTIFRRGVRNEIARGSWIILHITQYR